MIPVIKRINLYFSLINTYPVLMKLKTAFSLHRKIIKRKIILLEEIQKGFLTKTWNMKTMGILLMGIVAMILFTSCEELTNMLDEFGMTVNTEYYEVDLLIPPAPAGTEMTVQHVMENDIEQTLQSEGYGNATIKGIKVIDASIKVQENSQVSTLNAIESVISNISTNNLPAVTLLTCTNNQPDASSLPMESDAADVSNFMQNSEYNLATLGRLKETLSDTLRIQILIKYQITFDVHTE
jgi:hypothetical protein